MASPPAAGRPCDLELIPADSIGTASAVDTVIIGSGPSALLLSFILSGHHPYVRPGSTHPDPQLQAKLASVSSLFDADFARLSSHFPASRLSYSTQALPLNTLLDTLIRPLGDTAPGLHETCIEWRKSPHSVPHLVVGAETAAGGQWQAECVASSKDIGALSYADLISLPEYGLEEYLARHGKAVPEVGFLRPSRQDVAAYFADWPAKVGISDSLRLGQSVSQVRRLPDAGFHIWPQNVVCKRVVLATGIFTHRIAPRPLLQPLLKLKHHWEDAARAPPLLIIGSGFSAADLILTHLPQRRKVLHLFQWDSSDNRSPLRACHPAAYPEYAGVFRRMKKAALAAKELAQKASASSGRNARPEWKRRKSSATGLEHPEWDELYEGLPNALIHAVDVSDDGESAVIILERPGGGLMERTVCGLEHVVGRRGSLEYLSPKLKSEVLDGRVSAADGGISNKTLREKVEDQPDLELAPDVFAVGSLLGDSLIRHTYGGCMAVAAEVTRRCHPAARRHGKDTSLLRVLSTPEIRSEEPKKREAFANGHIAAEFAPLANMDGHIMPMWRQVAAPDEARDLKMEESCAV